MPSSVDTCPLNGLGGKGSFGLWHPQQIGLPPACQFQSLVERGNGDLFLFGYADGLVDASLGDGQCVIKRLQRPINRVTAKLPLVAQRAERIELRVEIRMLHQPRGSRPATQGGHALAPHVQLTIERAQRVLGERRVRPAVAAVVNDDGESRPLFPRSS